MKSKIPISGREVGGARRDEEGRIRDAVMPRACTSHRDVSFNEVDRDDLCPREKRRERHCRRAAAAPEVEQSLPFELAFVEVAEDVESERLSEM